MCKHENGVVIEFVREECHLRSVKEGKVRVINESGGVKVMYWEFRCFVCKRNFIFSKISKAPKWFRRYLDY